MNDVESQSVMVSFDESSATAEATDSFHRRSIVRPIPLALTLGIVIASGFGAFERIGTSANADTVEFVENLAGGFLAVGMTEEQPGFILLSALDRDQVQVSAELASSVVAGTRTFIDIETSRHRKRIRLRSPRVLLVDHQGQIQDFAVNWTYDDFETIRAGTDCSLEWHSGTKRCGAPFADLDDLLVSGRFTEYSKRLRSFLESAVNDCLSFSGRVSTDS